jgi:putative flippase GtrA
VPERYNTQFTRFVVVGVLSNLVLYFFYILFSTLGMGHKLAMTIMYVIGVAQTFVFNRNWTFAHRGSPGPALRKYLISYALGYILNLFVLWWLVDRLGYPHELVQAAMIILLAVAFFLTQRYWIFRQNIAHTL